MALGFEVTRRVPRSAYAVVQLAVLVALTGLLFGVICITVIGGAYVAIINFAH